MDENTTKQADGKVVAENFYDQCREINSYTEWETLFRKNAKALRMSPGEGLPGVYYKNRAAWKSGFGICYVPERSRNPFSKAVIKAICLDVLGRGRQEHLDEFADMVFDNLRWDHPRNVAFDVLPLMESRIRRCEEKV